ncbi:MAG: hypothetical protein JXQ75_09575 [Phycisphaerae bacterium]|nr:hypothetical protein [Phycisphaerae bacterium]
MAMAFNAVNRNRRRVTVVASTLACLAAVDVLVRCGDKELRQFYIDPYERKRTTLTELSPRPEIVLMGSSRANYGFVPEEFRRVTGRRTFNLAVPGSKVIEWQCVARDCLQPLEPSLVVLGVNASALRADYSPLPAARHLFTWSDMVDYCESDGWSGEVVRHFLLRNVGPAWATFHRRYEVKMLIQEQVGIILPKYAQLASERRAWVAKPCPPDGYEHPWLYGRRLRDLQAQLDEDGEAKVWAASVPAFSPDARAIDHFGRLLAWFTQRGIPLMVAYLPNSPRTENRWAEVEPGMINILAAVCHEHGIPFISCFRDELPRTNRDFVEELHAGLPLARRISLRVAGHVQALGLLEDDRLPRMARIPEGGPTPP